MTQPWLVCILCLYHKEAGCCLILSHAEVFVHMLALLICGLHSMDFWVRVEENFEGFGDVSWHGNVNISLVVIPVNVHSTLVLPFKLHGDLVIYFKSFQ